MSSVFSTAPADSLNQARDSWLAKDKAAHFLCSALLTGAGAWIHSINHNHGLGQDIRFGAGFAFILGLAKEGRDMVQPRNRWSWKDLAANLAGIALAVILLDVW